MVLRPKYFVGKNLVIIIIIPYSCWCSEPHKSARLILGLCPANERRRYKVTLSLIGWSQT